MLVIYLVACDATPRSASSGSVSRAIRVGQFQTAPGPLYSQITFDAQAHGSIAIAARGAGSLAVCIVQSKDAAAWTARTRQLFDSTMTSADAREVVTIGGPTMPDCEMKLMRESQRGEPYTTFWMQTTRESAPVVITVSPRQARHILALMDSSIEAAK